MKRKHLGFFFLFFAFLSYCQQCTISLTHPERQWNCIDTLLSQPASIIQIHIDDPYKVSQFAHILPSVPALLCANDLKRIIFYLAATNRYEAALLTRGDTTIHIRLIPRLIFDRVNLGHQFNGQLLAHHYLLKPGMPFDHTFHRQAIAHIEKAYKQLGYADVNVQDAITQSDSAQVQVKLQLHKGQRSMSSSAASDAPAKFFFQGNKHILINSFKQLPINTFHFYEQADGRKCSVANSTSEIQFTVQI